VTSLTLATLLQASILSTGADTYAAAYRTSSETGKPLVVMIGTEWCGPCQRMKRTILPCVWRRGLRKKVCFATVNPDHDRALAEDLTDGGPIPQLLMFRMTRKGWMRRKLVGARSIDDVERFINRGLALDAATNGVPAERQSSPPSEEKTKVRPVGRD